MSERAVIDRLGAKADGIAETEAGPLYVAYALPGETVRIEREGMRGRLLDVEHPSPDRATPFCPYFGTCGGCLTQHVAEAAYRRWKRGLVVEALRRAGIEAEIAALIDAHGAGRRRLILHARRGQDGVEVGYMRRGSHALVAITHCPVAEPALEAAPEAARRLAERLGPAKPLDIQVTATEAGFDVDIRGHGPASDAKRLGLVEEAARLDLARLSLHGEVLVERRAPVIAMGPARVTPPPGGFLQATASGEEVLASLVVEACTGAKPVLDLFAGCGPFALRLAVSAEVHAVEQDAAALASLERAARATSGMRRITTERRDLFRRPLLAPELERFEAVVIDPPRAGAEAQMRRLAEARVATVASVSCDAGTFARDAALLLAGGYRLEQVTPVDQFKHTSHVELVGVFRRATARARRRGLQAGASGAGTLSGTKKSGMSGPSGLTR